MRRNAFTLAYCELAGGGFTHHPAARRTATAGASVCAWTLRLLGAGNELFPANAWYRAPRLPGGLSLVGKRLSGQLLSGLLV